jgi:hypothetical protein
VRVQKDGATKPPMPPRVVKKRGDSGTKRCGVFGSETKYLNVIPSKKSLKKARDAIREKTGPNKC